VLPYVMFGNLAVVATLLLGLHRALRPPIRGRWTVSALFLAWFFVTLFLAWLGFYRGSPSRIPTIQYGVFLPIIAGVILLWRWPLLRSVVESMPQPWIVGIQLYRVLGSIFLVLYAAGRMPEAFAWPAGVGDILVGLFAPITAIAYARGWRGSAGLLRAWNLFGIADLVVALTTGFLTSPSPLQLLAFDKPNQLISEFPVVMIPVFLVPLSILLHLVSLQKLRRTNTERHFPERFAPNV
jgi:hypothetical protein